jgi:protein kinase C substrate 80K-H
VLIGRLIVFDISSYLPDPLLPKYVALKESVAGYLETLGIARGAVESSATESTLARKAYDDAEYSLKLTREEKQRAEEEYADLFDVEGFGREGEWKKLEGLCLEKNTGEYTYEVCLFDEARQKPNKGGTTFSLGKFASWNTESADVIPGNPEYYSKQYYKNGAKCWNGPHRSVILVLSCGTENAIHTIAELEKCEYQFTGTTPALCLPLEDTANAVREEL